MLSSDQAPSGSTNPPLAVRMAAIAFLNQNITIACVWGSFSVLLGGVETRLAVGRELSTLAVPLINLATAVCAPIAGMLATRHSIRLVMLAGAILSVIGFALLATTASYPIYLVAFGVFLGPGMAAGAVLPATLVTRWFVVDRGKALGIVCAPLMVALVPLIATWTLHSVGVSGTYATLALLSAITVIANLFIVDHPRGDDGGSGAVATPVGTTPPTPLPSMLGFLRIPRFWALALAFIASISGSIIITAHMVPLAQTWGMSATLAASLLAIQSFAGLFGTILFGWLADRLGGARTLLILLFDAALLWLLLLTTPPFAVTAVIVGLVGLHGAGAVPVLGIALAEQFGRDAFSRVYGLINLVNLPFSVVAVPAAAIVYARTGSYSGAIVGEAAFLAIGATLLLGIVWTGRRGRSPA